MDKNGEVLAEKWVLLAEEDILSAETLINNLERPKHGLYHFHQAVEKMFKALILLKGGLPLRIHDLGGLALVCHAPSSIVTKCQDINAIYQESRYSETRTYSIEEYDNLVESAQEVIEWTRNEISS